MIQAKIPARSEKKKEKKKSLLNILTVSCPLVPALHKLFIYLEVITNLTQPPRTSEINTNS